MKSLIKITMLLLVIAFGCVVVHAASPAEEKYSAFMEKYWSVREADKSLNTIWKCGRKILDKEEFSNLLKEQRKWMANRNKIILGIPLSENGAEKLTELIYDRNRDIGRYIYECKIFDKNNEFKKIDKNIKENGATLDLRGQDGWQQRLWYHLEGNNIISSEQQGSNHGYNIGYWYVENNNVILVINDGREKIILKVDGDRYIPDGVDGDYFSVTYRDLVDDNKDAGVSYFAKLESQANDGESAYIVSKKYAEIKNTVKSAIWCIKAAEYGYKKAYEDAAGLLIAGESIPGDFKKGLSYYKKAEESGTLSDLGKVNYALDLRRYGNERSGEKKILDLARNVSLVNNLPEWSRDFLFIVAAYIELNSNDNADNAIEYWDKVVNKKDFRDVHSDVEREFNYLDARIPKLKAENAPKSNEDVLHDFKGFYFSNFPQQEGYKSIWESFSAFFADPVWNVYRMEKYKNTYAIVFKGISSYRGVKRLYEYPFVLKYKNGLPKFEPGQYYGLFCKANGKLLSGDDYTDILYTIMLETKM